MLKDCSPKEADTPHLPYLVFAVRGSRYAVEACAVREIVWLPEITPIEEALDHVVGVVNLRGKILPVLDLNLRFGHPPQRYGLDDSVVVMESEGGPVGLIVNQVHAVRELTPAEDEVLPAVGPGAPAASGFISGLGRSGDLVVMILHRENLLRLPETLKGSDAADELLTADSAPLFCADASPEERSIFRQRARELARPLAGQDAAGGVPLAVIRMSGELFGIDLRFVREFAELRGVTPVPCCPEHILGQMNLRGDLFTLVDLGSVLKLTATGAAPGGKVVMLDIRDLGVGVPVEEVIDVRYFLPAELAPVPAGVRPINAAYLQGTAPHGDRMLSILDLPRIFAQEQLIVNEEH